MRYASNGRPGYGLNEDASLVIKNKTAIDQPNMCLSHSQSGEPPDPVERPISLCVITKVGGCSFDKVRSCHH